MRRSKEVRIITQELDKERVLMVAIVVAKKKDYWMWYRRLERSIKKWAGQK